MSNFYAYLINLLVIVHLYSIFRSIFDPQEEILNILNGYFVNNRLQLYNQEEFSRGLYQFEEAEEAEEDKEAEEAEEDKEYEEAEEAEEDKEYEEAEEDEEAEEIGNDYELVTPIFSSIKTPLQSPIIFPEELDLNKVDISKVDLNDPIYTIDVNKVTEDLN